jgi:hypothetical protein
MSWEYKLRLEQQHLLADLPGGAAIVDTGSPMSLAWPDLPMPFPEMTAGPIAREVLGCIRQNLGMGIGYLIGCDVLGRDQLVLDLVHGDIRAGEWRRPERTFALNTMHGLPAIEVSHGDEACEAILDSGAQYSYVPAAVVAGAAPIATATDFHPLVGGFEVQLYEVELTTAVGSHRYCCAVLPPQLDALARLTDGWIVGVDFFLGRNLLFDFKGGWLAQIQS